MCCCRRGGSEFREQAAGEALAVFHPPLIECVDVPDRALHKGAVFVECEQRTEAEAAIMRAQADWPAPIVSTIEGPATWYPAEDYHQDYWDGEGQRNPYCLAVIPPKLAKLKKGFAEKLVS